MGAREVKVAIVEQYVLTCVMVNFICHLDWALVCPDR